MNPPSAPQEANVDSAAAPPWYHDMLKAAVENAVTQAVQSIIAPVMERMVTLEKSVEALSAKVAQPAKPALPKKPAFPSLKTKSGATAIPAPKPTTKPPTMAQVVSGSSKSAPSPSVEEDMDTSPPALPGKSQEKIKASKRGRNAAEDSVQAPSKKAAKAVVEPKGPSTSGPRATPAGHQKEASQKCPPVIIHDKTKWSKICADLKANNIAIPKAKVAPEGIRTQVSDINHFRALTRFLDDQQVAFHTYALSADKPLKVVLRGLPAGLPVDEVKMELEQLGFHPAAVSRMQIRDGRGRKEIDMVLVSLPRDERAIYDLTRLCNLVISPESLKRKKTSGQCFRCQKWGHSQSGCRAKLVCVKCAEEHLAKDCQKSKEDKAKCANCGGPHPASYRSCPKWPKPDSKQATPQEPRTAGSRGTPSSSAPKVDKKEPKKPVASGKQKKPTKVVAAKAPAAATNKDGWTTVVSKRSKARQTVPEEQPHSSKGTVTSKRPRQSVKQMTQILGQMLITFGETEPSMDLYNKFWKDFELMRLSIEHSYE